MEKNSYGKRVHKILMKMASDLINDDGTIARFTVSVSKVRTDPIFEIRPRKGLGSIELASLRRCNSNSPCVAGKPDLHALRGFPWLDSDSVSLGAGPIHQHWGTADYVRCAPARPAGTSEISVQNPRGHHQPASGTGSHRRGILRVRQAWSPKARPEMVG